MEQLITLLAESCGHTYSEIISDDRTLDVSLCRQIIWHKLRQQGYSTRAIARICKRVHPCVIYGARRANELLSINDTRACYFLAQINKVEYTYPDKDKIHILAPYSEKFGVSVFSLLSESRDNEVVLKRFIIYRDLHRKGRKCEEIASIFNKSKQSVSHGIAKVKDLEYTRDSKYMENINKLKS